MNQPTPSDLHTLKIGTHKVRKNPLLYSDHSEIEESATIIEEPNQNRSVLFYFIILANSLLVVFVLGVIWFLFLKSPDIQIQNLTDRFFGTNSSTQAESTPVIDKTADKSSALQDQEETQQTRLKQMRAQKELAAESQRLEKLRVTLESEKKTAEAATQAKIPSKSPEVTQQVQTGALQNKPSQVLSDSTTNKEPAIVPNAASETKIPQSNSTSSQVDQIMETLKKQQLKKKAESNDK